MQEPKEEKLFDRELSWLEFNSRVLAEALDASNPLLERLKFLGIVSSNFDEFFMVRVAALKDLGSDTGAVYDKAYGIIRRQHAFFLEVLVPALEAAGIRRVLPHNLSEPQREHAANLFRREIFPLLTPIALKETPLPLLSNLSLYVVARLFKTEDPGTKYHALIEMPKNFPRMISLPTGKGYEFMLVEDLVSLFSKELFVGYEIEEQGVVRITRGAEFSLDEEKDEDFAKVMQEALRRRRSGGILRLEAAASGHLTAFLKDKLELEEKEVLALPPWLDLKAISQLAFQPAFEDLKLPPWVPKKQPEFEQTDDIWSLLKKKDVLIHHPYESFDAVSRFIREAANDPDVLMIKQTLYRAGHDPGIISSLEKAAEKGKQVTVLVELKARFDEEKNIEWAKRLENAGASVLYGVAGFKTHVKACLVVRREPEGIARYVHLSTGNYNERTAQVYSDVGLFSTKPDLVNDISALFNVITGYSQPTGFSKIEMAPYGLKRALRRAIVREAMHSTKAEPGLILAKMNSLVDPDIIEALYRASKAGVQIKLNVRGICCLRPGVPGLSENIEVISIVDRFLEHSRIFYFSNGGGSEVYLSSADWMPRNLERRIEIMFPVEDAKNKKELIDLLKLYFKDNAKSWKLMPDGSYVRLEPGTEKKFRVQEYLSNRALDRETAVLKALPQELKPQRPKLS